MASTLDRLFPIICACAFAFGKSNKSFHPRHTILSIRHIFVSVPGTRYTDPQVKSTVLLDYLCTDLAIQSMCSMLVDLPGLLSKLVGPAVTDAHSAHSVHLF